MSKDAAAEQMIALARLPTASRRLRCAALITASAASQERYPEPHHPHRRAVPGRRHHRHAGAAVRAAHERDARPERGGRECRRRRRLDRRRPGRQGRARRLHAPVPQHHLHDHHVVAAVRRPLARTTSSRTSCRSRSAPMCRFCCWRIRRCRRTNLKEFVAYAKQAKDAAVLRLDRAGQHHESDGRGAQARRRHQDGSRAVPRRRAAGAPSCCPAASSSAATSCRARCEHVRTGALKALAVATTSAALPDVPTVRELGFPNLELHGWNGFLAPKGTPEPIVARLNQEIAAAAKHPDVRKRMTDVGAEPSGSTPGGDARRCCASRSPR